MRTTEYLLALFDSSKLYLPSLGSWFVASGIFYELRFDIFNFYTDSLFFRVGSSLRLSNVY